DAGGLDVCGPNGECATGFVCDRMTNKCVQQSMMGTPDAPPDAPLPPDAPILLDAPRPTDARPDARPASSDAPPALLSLPPPSLDFGSVTLGDASPALTFTVTNDGGSPSGSLQASLDDASFSVSGGTCIGVAVDGASSCTVLVTFAPAGAP